MIEYKHPVEYVPLCIRLFFFFFVMAWVSLFNSKEGQKMIDLVEEGEKVRRLDIIKKGLQRNRYE